MNTQPECPICIEIIDFKKNCLTTECGHCFHTNCLMTSVAHNGFGCPYCRTAMAQEIKEEEEDEEDENDWYDDDEEEEMFSDDSLRAFRFFMNNINGIEHDQQDIEEEEESEDEESNEEEAPVPSAEFLAKKMIEDGVTMEQMVQALLLSHAEYEDNEEFERIDSELYGKLRIIISNYTPAEQNNEPPKIDRQNLQTSGMHPFITQRFNRVI
jgi:hypothetical protein